ncbi:transposase [Streptomyces sp. RLB1-33]
MSLLERLGEQDAFAEPSRFRTAFYGCLSARADAFFEPADALLCADGPVKTPVELSLTAEHRRGYGSLYGALNHGRLDVDRLRDLLVSVPLPRFDGRIVLSVGCLPRGCARMPRARRSGCSATSTAAPKRPRSSFRAGPTPSSPR